ncbi:MAG: serine/threonine-protein phosphatase [Calditrichaeota bacterium]|nr:serine/threonine-protein phosphatase [Calditrichota bacterium]
MKTTDSTSSDNQKIGKTILNDLHQTGLWKTIRDDFLGLQDFFLTRDRKKRLQNMGKVKRWLFLVWWLLKTLFFKLTPARRILLLIALFLMPSFQFGRTTANTNFLGELIILFVLMLELKDKLVAQNELAEGRAIQKALAPPPMPNVPNWELWLFTQSANEVGGDLIDFLELDQDRYAVALGDVSGKGLPAALLMAKLQATIRALAPEAESLPDLVFRINRIFYRDVLPQNFSSLVYLELGSNSHEIRFINAGHLPPVVVTKMGFKETSKGGPALGLLPNAEYSQQTVILQEGDFLLIYSDGLTEALNEQGEFFGEERLFTLFEKRSHLSAREMGEKLLADVRQFVGHSRLGDDLSLVVLKRIA